MSNLKEILEKKKICKSVWFMRQAGRYLPEFRRIRLQNQNFIDLCLSSELITEITLQPIKRYNLNSAIIFSDILMVPYALNQRIEFIKNNGPLLEKFNLKKFLDNNNISFIRKLQPIYKAIQKTRKELDKEKSLIGFIGAPWTLLIYMLGIKKNKKGIDYKKIEINGNEINLIFNKLNDYLCKHIEKQVDAGVDVIQIFDSWAGLILPKDLYNYCYMPNLKIVDFCKKKKVPVICFPKGLNKNYKDFNNIVKPNAISLDYDINPSWVRQNLADVVLQGGLNPNLLLSSDKEMIVGAKKYLDIFKGLPYIFNLGHGLLPQTDPDKVSKLIKFYREY
tara:strand:+ start:171 stop:1175 length:1005 start_codon:yes stop_codon:yes gene_type:complete